MPVNLSCVVVREDDGKVRVFLQAKGHPFHGEEYLDKSHDLYRGRVVHHFRGTSSFNFMVLICLDYLYRDLFSSNIRRIVDHANQSFFRTRQGLDALFVIQANPKPEHRAYREVLSGFYGEYLEDTPGVRDTVTVFGNCSDESHVEGGEGHGAYGVSSAVIGPRHKLGNVALSEFSFDDFGGAAAAPPAIRDRDAPLLLQPSRSTTRSTRDRPGFHSRYTASSARRRRGDGASSPATRSCRERGWRGSRARLVLAGAAPAIAVLPFADISPKHDQEHFADGVAEEIPIVVAHLQGPEVNGGARTLPLQDEIDRLRPGPALARFATPLLRMVPGEKKMAGDSSKNPEASPARGLERETGFEPATLSLGRRVDQPSTFPSAPNSSERLGPGRIVTSQNPQPLGTAPNRPAAPLLQGTNAPATAGAPLRVVDGGRGNLLTVRAVAGRLGVSTATVYKLVAQGDLPHARVSNAIRISPDDIAAYLVRCRSAGR